MDQQQAVFSPFAVGSPQRQQQQGMIGSNSRYLQSMSSPGAGAYGGSSSYAAAGGGFSSPGQASSAAASPAMMHSPAIAAAELLSKATSIRNGGNSGDFAQQQQQLQLYGQQQQQQQQHQFQQQQSLGGSPWRSLGRIDSSTDDALAAAVAAAAAAATAGGPLGPLTPPVPPPPPPPYYGSNPVSPLNRAASSNAQQLLLHHHHQQQQQQAALARSLSVDVGAMSAHSAGGGYGGMGGGGSGGVGAGGGRWGSGRLPWDSPSSHHSDQQARFGSVYDMKSLTSALAHVQAGTGDVRRMLSACTFRPRLPGLTKLVSQMSREGHWAKSLEVYESLDAVGVRPDTTITNASISACDKGGQWEKALQIFKSMSDLGMERDAITYSALISALSKGRQWGFAIDVFNHMVDEGVECDAVTCCSLITALDKGGQWQLAEQVFIQMYRHHPQFHVLLEGMDIDPELDWPAGVAGPPGGGNGSAQRTGSSSSPEMHRASSLLAGTFTTAALNALSISDDTLPPPEQLLAMVAGSGPDAHRSGSGGRDQTKPPSPGQHSSAGAGAAGPGAAGPGAASGKWAGQLQATAQGITHTPGLHTQQHAGNTTANSSCVGVAATTSSTSGTQLLQTEKQAEQRSSTAAAAAADEAEGPIRTLSGAWSKIVASKAVAEALLDSSSSAAGPSHNTAASATGAGAWPVLGSGLGTACSRGSSDESLLTAHDAVVHLMPAGLFRAIDAIGASEQGDSSSASGAPSAAAAAGPQASGGVSSMLQPGTSAFAAAGSTPLETEALPAVGGSLSSSTSGLGQEQQLRAGAPPSPLRPPLHPPTARSAGAASSGLLTAASAGQQGLSPSGSLGGQGLNLSSPSRAGSASPVRVGSGNMMRLGLTRSLNSKKSSPNRVCCNALLAAYARAAPPRWRQALKLLDVMWQCGGELVPDIVSYNTVMKACGNAQQIDRAFELYTHMQQRGIGPTVATFGTLITIASEAQAYDRVKESWGWLQQSGLPVHITCVNSYLTALIKEDAWDAAVELFQQLKSNQLGVRPNSVTYNILMSACLARDRPQNVKVLFDEMTAANLSPTLISFNTLLHGYAKMGAWQDSLAVLQHMCTTSPVRPSTTSFNTVFCTLGNVAAAVSEADKQVLAARALDVYTMMTQQPGLHPDSALYRSVLTTFAACSAPKMVLQTALIMVQQGHTMDAPSASAALEALQQEGAWGLSAPLLAACLEAGALVSPLLLQHILLVATQDKDWRVAKEVLQVTNVAGQLDSVAQLLQQTRTQLQAAGGASSPSQALLHAPGLVSDPEAVDELLLLTYLQAQYSNGGWEEASRLFKQLQQNRGPSFAVYNGVLLGSLLELLVVRGGPQGTLEAVGIVDSCHIKGVMSHYLPPLLGSSPARADSAGATAATAGLLTPEQRLIWQLESGPATAAAAPAPVSPAAAGFSLFPGLSTPAQQGSQQTLSQAGQGLDLSGALSEFVLQGSAAAASAAAAAEGFSHPAGQLLGSGPMPLTLLDVRGTSAIEALVLTLSWLDQVVGVVACGQGIACSRLRVETGAAGPLDALQMLDLKLTAQIGGSSTASQGSADAQQDAAATGGMGRQAADGESSAAAESSTAVGDNDAAAPAGGAPAGAADGASTNSSSLARSASSLLPAAAAAAASAAAAAASRAGSLQVPGSNLSVHAVVLAVFSGQLGSMLACADAMELLVAFSVAGRLPLALMCLYPPAVVLPEELAGGGVELDAVALTANIKSAIAAANGEGAPIA